jgi:hypothetical protein
MATQVTVITGEGSTTYSVSTGARGPAGPAGTGGGGATPAGTTGSVQINNSGALAADSGLVYTGTGNTGVLKIGGGSVIMSDPAGLQNVAIGGGNPTLPFANRTTGNYNTSVGTGNLPLLTTGSGNVAIGTSTLSSLLGGSNNVGVGVNALNAVTSGSGNVSLGNGAGAYITTGFDNICIGGGNPVESTNFSSISIGSTGDGNRTTVIGIAGSGTATTQTRLVGNTLILGHDSTTTSRTSLVQSASASAKTITLPNATGTVPVYTNAAALGKVLTATDNTGVATWETPTTGAADTTVIDGSTNAVSGNAVFDALALKAPTASPTLSGTVTATGQISSSGSTDATVSTNVVNVATNDARYSGPKFSAYSNVNQSVPTATFTKILYPLTDFNISAGYNIANSRFTTGKAGYYLLTVGARPQTNANSSIFYLYKNGVQLKTVFQDSAHAAVNRAACLIVNASATDYFEVFCWHNKGTDLTVEHNLQSNGFFQATFIP